MTFALFNELSQGTSCLKIHTVLHHAAAVPSNSIWSTVRHPALLGVSSVRAAVASRTALPELVRREEATRTGVYLLVGPDPDLPGRQVKTRLAAHDADESKEFFTRAVLIVSKDENLTKAHGRYLD